MPQYDNIGAENKKLKIKAVSYTTSSVDSINDFSRVFHEDIEIKYFFEGSSTLCVGTETVVARAGDVVVINPYEFHSTVGNAEEKGRYHLLMIELDFFGSENGFIDLRHLFMAERTRITTLIKSNPRISRLVEEAVLEMENRREHYENAVRGIVLELFSLLLRDYKDSRLLNYPNDKSKRHYQVIYPAIRMIRGDCTKEHGIEEMALACNVSKYHFCRIFKESIGMSAVEYRNEYRLQTANVLLRTTDKTVSEIALQCGFDDPAYFSRLYKKRYGVSPQKNRARLSK